MRASTPSAASAAQEAYLFMREKILTGVYASGSRLVPGAIARELGISRIPVREALRQLEADGLVTMRPNRAPLVAELEVGDFLDLYEIRAVLEGQAMRHVASRLDAEAMHELAALLARMDRARGNAKLWMKRHAEFHQALCDLAGRPRLSREIARIREAVEPYVLMCINNGAYVEMRGHEHAKLLKAIASADPARAERAITQHIRAAADMFRKFLKDVEARSASAPSKGDARRRGRDG
jgi:DNA-binding GntR family transcriptional regulator